MIAAAFQPGNYFSFPGESEVYVFISIYFVGGKPWIAFERINGETDAREGFYLEDLIKRSK